MKTGCGIRSVPTTVLTLLLVGITAASGQAPTDKAAQAKSMILFLAQEKIRVFKLEERVSRELAEQGFVTAWHASLEDLTLPVLQQFHAVILYYHHVAPKPTERIRAGLSCLRDYVSAGGGLLVTKDLYTRRGLAFYRELLAPLGAEVLLEQIADAQNAYKLRTVSGQNAWFAWTDAIATHPATEGVEGLFYSTGQWEPGEPGVVPLKADANWQVLVRGMPDASSYVPAPTGARKPEARQPGTFSASPPLLAVRAHGQGRVALWPTLATFTLMDGYSLILEDGLVMRGRRRHMRSDGARLTYNLLHWLAAPARSLDAFGGYVPPAAAPAPEAKADLGFQRLDWEQTQDVVPAFERAYLGLIGARTALSTGQGTPEAFIAAARAAGYQFIVFCEQINAMPEASWDTLVKACTDGSDASFRALPGMYYLDNEGDAFVVLGDIGYPPPEWADPENPEKKILYNGTIRMAVNPIPPIIMLPLKTNKRPVRLHSSFYGYAVQVYENGELLVEDWDSYFMLQKEGLALFPTAVHMVTAPEQVASARQRGMQAYIRADALDKLLESVDMTSHARGRYFKPAFASSGPEVCTLFARNWGTSDLAIPGNDRYRVQMLARSDRGLAEVALHEGGRVIRRYLLDGVVEFKQTVDMYHDRQRSFVMVASDVDGGKAVSWPRNTNAQECWFVMCGDNMNDMGPSGKFALDAGRMNLRGTECKLTLRSPAVTQAFPTLAAQVAGATFGGWASRHASMKETDLVSRFGLVVRYGLDYHWDGPGRPGAAHATALAHNSVYGGHVRKYYFARRTPGPHLEIREYELTVKQDITLSKTPGVILLPSSNWGLPEGALDHIVYFTPDGGRVVEQPTAHTGRQYFRVTISPGEYMAVYPMCTAVFPLGEPLHAFVDRHPVPPYHTTFQVGLGRAGETLAQGTVMRARFAVLELPFAALGTYKWLPEYKRYWSSNLLAEDVRTKLGLAGAPAYEVTASVGSVVDTKLALTLESDGNGFRATIKRCHLPVALPVFIRGLNPNWSAGVWYKGRNRLLQTEWPERDPFGDYSHTKFIQVRAKKDEIIRFGIFDGDVGYLQLDLELDDRDVFIGNLVTCERQDIPLVFHRSSRPGAGAVEVHNPTAEPATVTVRPGKGFDLFGAFAERATVPPGSSCLVDVGPRKAR